MPKKRVIKLKILDNKKVKQISSSVLINPQGKYLKAPAQTKNFSRKAPFKLFKKSQLKKKRRSFVIGEARRRSQSFRWCGKDIRLLYLIYGLALKRGNTSPLR